MKIFEGETGRWLTVEWLPPYLLVIAIVPLTVFWKTPADTIGHALLHVLGAGDLLAVNFCLILSAIAAAVFDEPSTTRGRPKNYFVPLQLVILIVFMLIGYAALKVVPVDAMSNVERAIWYGAFNVVMSFWSSSLICVIKTKGTL